jgi:RNA polymerase sigma factor (sigma-70 family)
MEKFFPELTMDIILVEDNEGTRYRLMSLLDGKHGCRIVASVGSAEEALEWMSGSSPDMVILDLGLPGLSDDLAVSAVKKACPDVEILVFSVSEEDAKIFAALKAGATGYILKGASPEEILAAVDEIRGGGSPMSNSIARKVLLEFQRQPAHDELKEMLSPLSKRESEILELLYRGYNYRHIADTLCISPYTVHTHIKKIYTKLQVNSRSEAIYEALQKRLLKG